MLILASASPRRQELLRNAGIPFEVQPAAIDETLHDGETPQESVRRLAREKALAVSRTRPNDYVLGADTIVLVDGTILGKPCDAADAAWMLRLLSGRTHEVITGVCLWGPVDSGQWTVASQNGSHQTRLANGGTEKLRTENRDLRTACETTLVSMSDLSDQEIRDYVSTGEPLDKAGAYAIQGMASRWIARIEGDYSNVVGLPVALVYQMLRERRLV